MFAGQEKSSFEKDAGINSLNSGNFIFKAYQCRQSCIQFTNWFYLKVITGHEKCKVDGTAETCLLNINFLAQKRKKLNKIVTFSVNLFLVGVFRGHQKMQFSQFCCNDFAILQRNEVLSAQSKIWSTNCKFFRETMFCEKLLWTRIKQFWRSLGKNFCCSQ